MKKITVLSLLLIALTGCWSKKELDNLAIVTGIGIDKAEEGYEVTVQIINPAEVAAKQLTTRTAVSTYSASGVSLFDAIRNLIEVTPRKVYMSHTRIVIFSEELAKTGISDNIDFLVRDHELRTDFYLAIAKGFSAKQMLNILTPLEKIPASKMYATIESSERYLAQTRTVKIQKFTSDLLLEGQQPFLTGIYIQGNTDIGNSIGNVEKIDSPAKILVDHIGAMKGDQLIGWLDHKESKGFNYLTGKVKNSTEMIPCNEDSKYTSFEIISTDKKIKGKLKDGKPTFTVDIKAQANIAQSDCDMKLSNPKTLKKLENDLNKEITNTANLTIEAIQKDLQSDIVGFGELLHRTQNKDWVKIKGQWDDLFPEADIKVNVQSKIKRTGTITDSFKEK
ncbi:Ger(x)C family spore germination protein [Pontibacillus sp. HMF3514]|uniref:Ger(x)C family spore germination protein n=1 Tax=Pontibacillus sp. HMF3514 TaxID=2692425 RepID=UPI00131FEC5D|nr:Ger(x)C family spore germination protein [Pontibacillus sp. HMF3514]QHE52432.1 Ger(x)C family spore germination protein [Pontibacillus sp. HMF3514]